VVTVIDISSDRWARDDYFVSAPAGGGLVVVTAEMAATSVG
jgi:hypothetical protein